MNQEEREFYEKHFQRWGNPTDEMNTEYRFYYRKPETLMSIEDIIRYDQNAAKDIKAMEDYIAFLKLHRMELTNRYNELLTDPSVEVVKLQRKKESWGSGKVYFYFMICKRYIDSGKETMISSKRYEGKDRREVLKMFDQYCKEHPNSIPEKDIEKARWEK